jgi:predicted AAA+ superfamily ATPase
MIKRKIDAFLQQFFAKERNALLITGARQTGKTFSIRQFGQTFDSFVEINFIEHPEAVELFRDAHGAADILLRLSAYTTVPLKKHRTLVFFDEVFDGNVITENARFMGRSARFMHYNWGKC